jgi:hypothetical protein
VGIGKLERPCDRESLFVHKTADPSTYGLRSGLLGMSSILEQKIPIHTHIQHDMTSLNPPADPKYCPQPAIPQQTHPVTPGRRTVLDTPSRCHAKSGRDAHAPQQALPRLSSVPPFLSLPHCAAPHDTLTVGGCTLLLPVNMQNGLDE